MLLACCAALTLLAGGCTAGRRVSLSCPTADGPPAVLHTADACRLPQAGYILLGESHTSPCDHEAQRLLLDWIGQRPDSQWPQGKPVVALEMVAADRQAALDRFNKKLIGLPELREALDWDRTWGHPWELYAPVFAAARAAGLPLHAANVPQRLVDVVRERGLDAAAPEDKSHLPETIILPGEEQLEFLRGFFDSHSSILHQNATRAPSAPPGGEAFERFVRVQSLWDTTMARNMVRLRRETGHPVLLIVGSGHVEHGWGVKRRLREFDPGAPVLSIMPARTAEELTAGLPTGEVRYLCPPSHYSRLGYAVEEREEGGAVRLFITRVDAGSPAATVGFVVGDILLGINDLPVAGIGQLQVIPMKLRDDPVLRYRIRRGDAEMELTLERRPF
ncbi:ChaN family lipoprotein [Megalodesulfovibrio paquesii]